MAAQEQFSPAAEICLEQPLTRAFMQEQDLGTGLLRVNGQEVRWEGESRKLALQYPAIILHAISRDTSAFPHECIFMLWDRPLELVGDGEVGEGEEEEEEEEEQTITTELRLVPPDKDQLEGIFEAICECQKLHPDSELSDSEDDGEGEEEEEEGLGDAVDFESGDFFTTPEGLNHLTTEGRAVLAHLENLVQLPSPEEFKDMVTNGSRDNSQFEDAD